MTLLFQLRRGTLIIRQLCVLLDAERVYRELSLILKKEEDLDFASIMVQVLLHPHTHFRNVAAANLCSFILI